MYGYVHLSVIQDLDFLIVCSCLGGWAFRVLHWTTQLVKNLIHGLLSTSIAGLKAKSMIPNLVAILLCQGTHGGDKKATDLRKLEIEHPSSLNFR